VQTPEVPAPDKPAHWQQHLDRKAREAEARRVRREYQQAQREAAIAALPHKVCSGCKQSLPLNAYSPKGPGKFNSRCRPCHSAKQAAYKRAKQAAWSKEQRELHRAADRAGWYARQGRVGETGRSLEERRAAQAAAKAARAIEASQRREAERAEADAARIAAKAARTAEAEAQRSLAKARKVASRHVELEARGQDTAAAELELAVACAAALEAQEKAQALSAIAAARAAAQRRHWEAYVRPSLAQRLAHLWPPERSLNVALRDGSRISAGQLASRHWWREQGRRIKRFSY
jgi:colicin import membrane protein